MLTFKTPNVDIFIFHHIYARLNVGYLIGDPLDYYYNYYYRFLFLLPKCLWDNILGITHILRSFIIVDNRGAMCVKKILFRYQ